jgi:hypothetical protein
MLSFFSDNSNGGFGDFGDFSGISSAATTSHNQPFTDFSAFSTPQAPPTVPQAQPSAFKGQQDNLLFADFTSQPLHPVPNEVRIFQLFIILKCVGCIHLVCFIVTPHVYSWPYYPTVTICYFFNPG